MTRIKHKVAPVQRSCPSIASSSSLAAAAAPARAPHGGRPGTHRHTDLYFKKDRGKCGSRGPGEEGRRAGRREAGRGGRGRARGAAPRLTPTPAGSAAAAAAAGRWEAAASARRRSRLRNASGRARLLPFLSFSRPHPPCRGRRCPRGTSGGSARLPSLEGMREARPGRS